MSLLVCGGAQMMCGMGMAPATLAVTSQSKTLSGMPSATIMDMSPGSNIPPFAMCRSLMNPMVAAATAAAFGVLTPQPCMPAPAGPWAPGSSGVMINGIPALTSTSKLMCAYGGTVQILNPGQTKTTISK